MTGQRYCPHVDAAPVEVRDYMTGGTIVVAHVCRDCLEGLPANWGCRECTWVDVRRLCDLGPVLTVSTRCERHTDAD